MKVPDEDIIDALQKAVGNVSTAAKLIGISRVTIYNRMKTSPAIKEAHAEFREQAIDNAESALQRAVLNGEAWAVCFTLKTIGKSRGYIERQELEHTGKGGGAVEVSITERMQKYESLFSSTEDVTNCNIDKETENKP